MDVKFLAETLFSYIKTVKSKLSSFRKENVTELGVD
jgi:hypothetical protein